MFSMNKGIRYLTEHRRGACRYKIDGEEKEAATIPKSVEDVRNVRYLRSARPSLRAVRQLDTNDADDKIQKMANRPSYKIQEVI